MRRLEYRHARAFLQVVPRSMPAGLVLTGTACAVSPECVEDLPLKHNPIRWYIGYEGFTITERSTPVIKRLGGV